MLTEGWTVEFLSRIRQPSFHPEERVLLGDFLLSMTVVRALLEACESGGAAPGPVRYRGPYGRLMERSEMEFEIVPGDHTGTGVSTAGAHPVPLEARPVVPPRWRDVAERPDRRMVTLPAWLDQTEEGVRVHADVPMRHYLQLEQDLGVRLPRDGDVAPRYRSRSRYGDDRHVVLVATSSKPDIKDYGVGNFFRVARELRERTGTDLRLTLLTNDRRAAADLPAALPVEVALGVDAADCVDLFGGAGLVIGNDTGLTHLAALTVRADGSGPQVIGLHNVFSPLKWVTGSPRHHTISTAFAQQVALADVDVCATSFAAEIDPTLWGARADLASLSPKDVAGFAAEVMDRKDGEQRQRPPTRGGTHGDGQARRRSRQ